MIFGHPTLDEAREEGKSRQGDQTAAKIRRTLPDLGKKSAGPPIE